MTWHWRHEMRWRHERTRRGVSSIFVIIILGVWTGAEETCEQLQCLNSNPCQTTLHADHNTSTARCVCGGRWTGPRCQHPIRLSPQAVTSSQARLTIRVMTSGTYDVAPSPGSSALSLVSGKKKKKEEEEGEGEGEEGVRLNYTLVYWRRNDTMTSLALDASFLTSGAVTCVLLHNKVSREPVLGGLSPSTRYTICVESGFVDSCVLSSFTDTTSSSSSSSSSSRPEWPSNCVTIYTPTFSPPLAPVTLSSTVTQVAVVSVFVLALLIVVFIVFLLRRQNLAFRLFLDGLCHRLCCCSSSSCSSSSSSSSSSSCCCCCSPSCRTDPDTDGSQDRSRLHHPPHPPSSSSYSFSSTSHQRPRSVFLNDDSGCPKKSPKKSLFKKPCQKKKQKQQERSSTYTSASMLLTHPTPPGLGHEAFAGEEASPLGFELGEDDAVFENSPPEQAGPALAALPTLLRNKPRRHRLSRKRRGYVTYSTRKDKNIRLTTVLESITGDEEEEEEFEEDGLVCARSSI